METFPCFERAVSAQSLLASGLVSTLLKDSDEVLVVDLLPGSNQTGATEGAIDGRTLVVVLADAHDERAGPWLSAARRARARALFVCVSEGTIACLFDDASSGPCVECALLFDAERARDCLSRKVSDRASRQPTPIHDLARAVLRISTLPGGPLPEPGAALLITARSLAKRCERYLVHPSCECGRYAPGAAAAPRRTTWRSIHSDRFPAVSAHGNLRVDGEARVLVRLSGDPWSVAPESFEIQSAAGVGARERATAKGIERFCLAHLLSERSCDSAKALLDARFDDGEIEALLYRDEERRQSGFRFPAFRRDAQCDWSRARDALTGESKLLPSSLVGRARAGVQLVDEASSACAADRRLDVAALRAALEAIERDAVLSSWYLRLPVIGIDQRFTHRLERGIVAQAYCATQDVDLPVVWLLARSSKGALVSASAADVSFDAAWASACGELEHKLAVPPAPVRAADLFDSRLRVGSLEHRSWYSDPANAKRGFEHPNVVRHASPDSLRERWPARLGASSYDVAQLLARVGLRLWLVDCSLPPVFGAAWSVQRAVVPGLVELSFGQAYRRLASARVSRWLSQGYVVTSIPHPF